MSELLTITLSLYTDSPFSFLMEPYVSLNIQLQAMSMCGSLSLVSVFDRIRVCQLESAKVCVKGW